MSSKYVSILDTLRSEFAERGWDPKALGNFLMSDAGGGTDTAGGFIQGAEPAQPRKAAEWSGQQNPAQQVSQPVNLTENQPPSNTGRFSEDDIARARQQEKEKLYPRIEEMDTQLKELKRERAEIEKNRKAEEQRLADEQRKKEEEQMELRDLLQRKDAEWSQKFAQIEADRERDRATYEMERKLMELEGYRIQRIEQEAEWIAPELRDLVRGNTIQEVDASIEDLKNRTNAIFGNLSAVTSQQPTPRGAAPTSPPVGPLEQLSVNQSLSPDDIRTMDIETYKKYRESLLASASRQYRGR